MNRESHPALAGLGNGRCFIAGEVALSHDGSLGLAHAFVDAIAAAGADAVKFQTHIAAAESTPSEPFRVKFSRQDATRYAYWQRMEFSEEQWHGLAEHARACVWYVEDGRLQLVCSFVRVRSHRNDRLSKETRTPNGQE